MVCGLALMKLRCMPYIRFHTLNFVLRLKNRPNPDFSTPNRENSPSQNNHAHLSPSSTGRVREFSNYAVDTRVLATTRNFWPISVERVAEKATKYVGLTKRLSTTIAKDPQESRIMRNIESKSVQRCQMAFDFDSSIYIVYNSH